MTMVQNFLSRLANPSLEWEVIPGAVGAGFYMWNTHRSHSLNPVQFARILCLDDFP